jgi:uncharacterized membrane protein YciS (DUF1049 family)
MNNADQRVDFNFFAKEYLGLSLNLLILLVFGTGMVFSFLIAVISEFNLRTQISQYRKDVTRLERELAALRNLPLEDAGPIETETDTPL